MALKGKMIDINADGFVVGECHGRATISNMEVEALRVLNENGFKYVFLAKLFQFSVHTIAAICQYKRRTSMAVAQRRVLRSRSKQ